MHASCTIIVIDIIIASIMVLITTTTLPD